MSPMPLDVSHQKRGTQVIHDTDTGKDVQKSRKFCKPCSSGSVHHFLWLISTANAGKFW
jgi:hypothetical protein